MCIRVPARGGVMAQHESLPEMRNWLVVQRKIKQLCTEETFDTHIVFTSRSVFSSSVGLTSVVSDFELCVSIPYQTQ
jgi:hypothetical protein